MKQEVRWVEDDNAFLVMLDSNGKWQGYINGTKVGRAWNTNEYAVKFLKTKAPTVLDAEEILKELSEVDVDTKYFYDMVDGLKSKAKNYFKDKRNAEEIYGT